MPSIDSIVTGLLREAEGLLRGLFDNALVGVYVIQGNQFVYVNRRLSDLFGYTQEGLCSGMGPLDVTDASNQSVAQREIDRRIRGDAKTSFYAFKGVRRDGSHLDVEVFGVTTEYAGKPAIIGILMDVSARTTAQRDVAHQLAFTQLLLDTIPIPVFYKAATGLFLGVNAAFESFIGVDRAGLIGRSVHAFAPRELADFYTAADARLLAAGGTQVHETPSVRGDGSRASVVVHKATFQNADGAIGGLVGAIVDVTEHKRLQRATRLLVDCNLVLAKAPAEADLLGDICRLVVETGGYLMAWVGYPQSDKARSIEVIARSGYEDGYLESVSVSWDESQDIGRGPAGRAIRTGQPEVSQDQETDPAMAPWREASRRRGYRSIIALPLLESGRAFGVLCLYASEPNVFNGDEIALLQELAGNVSYGIQSLRTEAQRDQARTAARAKSVFLANMSHEIRTPLNAILGMAHLVRKEGVSPRQAQQLQHLDDAAGHLLSVLNDILDFSKIEADRLQLERAEFSVEDVMTRVGSMIAHGAKDKGLMLTSDIQNLPCRVFGDATRLTQALLNYANNAVKFTRQGSVVLRSRILEEGVDHLWLRFEVEDTGIGITTEHLGRLFASFEQGDPSTTREFGGTGLGLIITKRLAQLMGGDAGVSSTPAQGSLFWFTARLEKSSGPRNPAVVRPVSLASENRLARDCAGCRILLVEDDPINRLITLELLRGTGLVVDSADNGVDAVAMAREARYDLVLMDMQMPRMDGVEATRRIRTLADWRDVPIIAITANVASEDRVKCVEAGMNDFLSKPVLPRDLIAKLLKWLPKAAGLSDRPERAAPGLPGRRRTPRRRQRCPGRRWFMRRCR